MFKPDDLLKPRDDTFDEAWHAQTLALADTMVQAGYFSASAWAKTLGKALASAKADGEPDTTQTYYNCALDALEKLTAGNLGISTKDLSMRKTAWEKAYLATPHGQPVKLAEECD